MACENCYAYITICLVSAIIGIYLIRKYSLEKNEFSLYMASFFIVDSIGWFIAFYIQFFIFSSYNIIQFYVIGIDPIFTYILNIPVIIAQIILLLFAFSVFDVSVVLRVVSVIVIGVAAGFSLIAPDFFFIINVIGMGVMILNIMLFFMNWQRNEDIKSLGFAFGMILIAIGQLVTLLAYMDLIFLILEGVFILMAAAIWLITFSGLLEKIFGESP